MNRARVTPGLTNDNTAGPLLVYINEWMAANTSASGIADPADADYDDWFELYNPGPAPVDLGGYGLTDNLTNRFQYRVPDNGQYVIPPGGHERVRVDPLRRVIHQRHHRSPRKDAPGLVRRHGAGELNLNSLAVSNHDRNTDAGGRHPDFRPMHDLAGLFHHLPLFFGVSVLQEDVGAPYIPFDGVTLDLEPGSVDRVVCFDSFHHVPNQQKILTEFHRVLAPDGIAVFCEPGPCHSLDPMLQHEMRTFDVIENDIVIEEIWKLAREVGFRDVKLSLFSIQPTLCSIEEFSTLQSFGKGRAALELLYDLAQARVRRPAVLRARERPAVTGQPQPGRAQLQDRGHGCHEWR